MGCEVNLKKEVFLGDAISDLPPVCWILVSCWRPSFFFVLYLFSHKCSSQVENSEERDEMPYVSDAETGFQHFIRLRRDGAYMVSISTTMQVYLHAH